jgi:hypothetical protein
MVSVQAGDSLAKTSTAKRLVIVLKWLFLCLGMVSYLLLALALRMEIHRAESRFIRGENDSTWTQLGAAIYGESPHDNLGWSVSLSADGNTALIGSVWNDD